eukprot:CAMPEP_0170099280 /NCGR_PEP_ID=MMETSP0020_2-20130122/943_1 /TAXON_ID=98059 /ORGANISM="Dinobryon sp., Strain UTEXLB2267" /LENGTH=452 /DNA_ID=CAMNT_0010321903 /DNA_START=1 /DNA_END=1359 /DNA_ORIENTATION=-
MGKSMIVSNPVGIEAFLSEWEPCVDAIHAQVGWVPPIAFLSPNQTLLVVNQRMDSDKEKSTSPSSRGSNRIITSVKPEIARSGTISSASFDSDSGIITEGSSNSAKEQSEWVPSNMLSASAEEAEFRLTAFYKSEFSNSSESFDSKYAMPSYISRSFIDRPTTNTVTIEEILPLHDEPTNFEPPSQNNLDEINSDIHVDDTENLTEIVANIAPMDMEIIPSTPITYGKEPISVQGSHETLPTRSSNDSAVDATTSSPNEIFLNPRVERSADNSDNTSIRSTKSPKPFRDSEVDVKVPASWHSANELCKIFGITSTGIFEGDKMRKKFSSDYMFKESLIWVDPIKKSLHWTKTANDKSNAKNSKFLYFVRNKYTSNNKGPSIVPPLGEQKGVVNSIDSIAGGILVSVENGEHLEIKIPQPKLLNDMMKVLKDLLASTRYDNFDGKATTKVIYF